MEDKKFVFISYCSKNFNVAEKIVNYLETENIKCYIAPRDITPGSIYSEEIVDAISNCACCLLLFSKESNTSNYVLKEINSATNHDVAIMPVKIDDTFPSKSLEFYLGTNHWVNCFEVEKDAENIANAIRQIMHKNNYSEMKSQQVVDEIKYKGPIVLGYTELEDIGYTAERRVVETIEIDYLTLEKSDDYVINEEIEGNITDWTEYANDYPDTCLGLIVNDKMVGYSQIEMLNENNYKEVITGKTMINATMEEFYGFGGDFYCYIAIMPIIKQYENSNNYLLLFNAFFKHMIDFKETGVQIIKYGISVYSKLLETIVKTLNFHFVSINPAGGKVYELDKEGILNSPIFKKKYPDFYRMYGEDND